MLKLKYFFFLLICLNYFSLLSKAEEMNSFLNKQVEESMAIKNKKKELSAIPLDNPLEEKAISLDSSKAKTTTKKNNSKIKQKTNKPIKTDVKEKNNKEKNNLIPISLNQNTASAQTETAKENKELKQITKERKQNTDKTIDAINFIQPSLVLSSEEQTKIDMALTRSEQEQLTILWRSTLERNKTIHFIVEKLAPDDQSKKKNQILSQVLNTAIFLPFYALQAVAPADTSQIASYLGAGLASDLINGKARKNSDKIQLSQTEMVIMFMMIDQVAERLREQYHNYKQERIDSVLAQNELAEAKQEAAASLQLSSSEAQFLSQIRIRQIERELRRINLRVRSNKIVLEDLSGAEAVKQVDQLIEKEIMAILDLPMNT